MISTVTSKFPLFWFIADKARNSMNRAFWDLRSIGEFGKMIGLQISIDCNRIVFPFRNLQIIAIEAVRG
jgi:hypothetical protein